MSVSTDPRRNIQVVEFSDWPALQQKLDMATRGLLTSDKKPILELSDEDKELVADFLNDCVQKDLIKPTTRRAYIHNLLAFSRYHKHKAFKTMTRLDISDYLNSLRRSQTDDPEQKWINTHNSKAMTVSKFYKYVTQPDLPTKERQPAEICKDIIFHKRKEKTSVKASDLWSPEDDVVFLKWLKDERLACFHVMASDTSARPHELLALKIGDIHIKRNAQRMYSEVEIGRGGKTKSRIVPLYDSIRFLKAWLAKHPQGSNPSAFLFISFDRAAKFKNLPLKRNSVTIMYSKLKRNYFPKLLESPDVPAEDKERIQALLQKPWNPYIRRHTSLTQKARLINEYSLRLHAGWSKSSKMVEIYTHELGGESSNELLKAYGILPDEEAERNPLAPQICPVCSEPNDPGAAFCSNSTCGLPLNLEGYEEMKKQEADREVEMMDLRARLQKLEVERDAANGLLTKTTEANPGLIIDIIREEVRKELQRKVREQQISRIKLIQ